MTALLGEALTNFTVHPTHDQLPVNDTVVTLPPIQCSLRVTHLPMRLKKETADWLVSWKSGIQVTKSSLTRELLSRRHN